MQQNRKDSKAFQFAARFLLWLTHRTTKKKNFQTFSEYSNYGGGGGGGGGMMPNNYGGQANFSVPPPSFGGSQQGNNWQPPSAGGEFIYQNKYLIHFYLCCYRVRRL